MYIKSLTIRSNEHHIIRDIQFRKGANLIVDTSRNKLNGQTTNAIGKTTVLKLINVCLGAKVSSLYVDTETRKREDTLVKQFIQDKNISVDLILENKDMKTTITRNLREDSYFINNKKYTSKEFINELRHIIFPNLVSTAKPTFRQMIARNIRIDESSINNVLRYLHSTTSKSDYEAIHLAMFGIISNFFDNKSTLTKEKKENENVIKKLLNKYKIEEVEQLLKIAEQQIEDYSKELNKYKKEEQVIYIDVAEKLNKLKNEAYILEQRVRNLEYSLKLTQKINDELNESYMNDEEKGVSKIYKEYSELFFRATKEFHDLLEFHNDIIKQKKEFVERDIFVQKEEIKQIKNELKVVNQEIINNAGLVEDSYGFIQFDKIQKELESYYVAKGRHEETLNIIYEQQANIEKISKEIEKINEEISKNLSILEENISIFNKHYSKISDLLYGEKYSIIYSKGDTITFSSSTAKQGTSTGKKQGEILCFDLAYILFAREVGIPHVDFILNDKKELLAIDQIQRAIEIAERNEIQLVFSILSDKLPRIYSDVKENVILELSSNDKLFRIEQY